MESGLRFPARVLCASKHKSSPVGVRWFAHGGDDEESYRYIASVRGVCLCMGVKHRTYQNSSDEASARQGSFCRIGHLPADDAAQTTRLAVAALPTRARGQQTTGFAVVEPRGHVRRRGRPVGQLYPAAGDGQVHDCARLLCRRRVLRLDTRRPHRQGPHGARARPVPGRQRALPARPSKGSTVPTLLFPTRRCSGARRGASSAF